MITTATPVTRAMILAAGLGTRFRPWTDRHPKALAPVNGKTLLQRNIEWLQEYGISDVVINVHHFADQIVTALRANRGWGSRITISDESSEVLETGGGLKKARAWLQDGPFVLLNVDVLTDLDLGKMIDDHLVHRPLATLAVTGRDTSRYFLFDAKDELVGWRNVRTGEQRLARGLQEEPIPKAFSGIHVIDPAIFNFITREGKFSMVDVYLDLAAGHPIRGWDHSRSLFIDVGRPSSAEEAARLFP
jgi:NDP-sugar pyrophosphorylase family protein